MPENFQSLLGDRKTLHTIEVSENNFFIWEITTLILGFVQRNGIWADFEKRTTQKYNQPEESALRENMRIWQRNK